METIVSLITAPMKAAIAVIRVSGDETLDIVSSCFSKPLPKVGNQILYGNFLDLEKNPIDEVVLSLFLAPKSYTGEDVVEISCHGSMLIASKIMETIIAKGARIAERGEFTARAFYNGKMDLVQAESVLSLIDAKTEEQRKLSLFALKGKASETLYPVKEKLADILSNIEVNIDYPEYEDIEEMTRDKIDENVSKIIKELDELIKDATNANIVLEGVKVALVGKPNVGKSSLLNALLNEDKAIVTDIPGTTRDIVEGDINLNGLLLHVIDTAGIRESDDKIESIGIEKSKEMIEKADLVIHLKDVSQIEDEEDEQLQSLIQGKTYIEVFNKKDLISEFEEGKIYISAQNKDITGLIDKIKELYQTISIKPSLASEREIGLLKEARIDLECAITKEKYAPLDLISIHLKSAYDALKRILGEEVSPDLEKEIFSRFCVGK